jgi:hypothetical protein
MPDKGRTSHFIGCERQLNWHHRPSKGSKIKEIWVMPAMGADLSQTELEFHGSYVHFRSPVFDLFQAEKRSLPGSGALLADVAPFLR